MPGSRSCDGANVEHLTLVGNSGGAALACLYQSQAERLTIETTPAGDPVALDPSQLPQADAIALAAAHPGRPQLLGRWLDASVVDERDPLAALPELDIYDAGRAVPFEDAFVARVRAASARGTMRSPCTSGAVSRSCERDPTARVTRRSSCTAPMPIRASST